VQSLFGGDTVSFGLPLAPGAVHDPGNVQVSIGGKAIAANVKALLWDMDASGAPTTSRSLLIQFAASALPQGTGDVDIHWAGGAGTTQSGTKAAYQTVSAPSAEVVATADRTITTSGGKNQLVETSQGSVELFKGREPNYLATYPTGYLARAGILGPQVT